MPPPVTVAACVKELNAVHSSLAWNDDRGPDQPRIRPGCLANFRMLVDACSSDDLSRNLVGEDDYNQRTGVGFRNIWGLGPKLDLLDIFLYRFTATRGYKRSGYTFELDEVLEVCRAFEAKGRRVAQSPALCFFVRHYIGDHHTTTKYTTVFPHPKALENWRKIVDAIGDDVPDAMRKRIASSYVEDWAHFISDEYYDEMIDGKKTSTIIGILDAVAPSADMKSYLDKFVTEEFACYSHCSWVQDIRGALQR